MEQVIIACVISTAMMLLPVVLWGAWVLLFWPVVLTFVVAALDWLEHN